MAYLWKRKYKRNEIFVVGKQPYLNYVPRKNVLRNLQKAYERLGKLIILTGPTKIGKTVLVRDFLKETNYIWCNCGSFEYEDEFWSYILNKYEGFNSVSQTTSTEREYSIHPILITFLKIISFGLKFKKRKHKTTTYRRDIVPKTEAIKLIEEYKYPIVIDDFHYLNASTGRAIVRALKGPVFDLIPIIIIAIPHKKLKVIETEPEMTGRIVLIELPPWDSSELAQIAQKGFGYLNLEVEEDIIGRLTEESIGSPHLMQEFCDTLCDIKQIDSTKRKKVLIKYSDVQFDLIFRASANDMGRYIFKRFRSTIFGSKDRIKRISHKGKILNVYSAVMQAFIDLKPGTKPIEFSTFSKIVTGYFKTNKPSERIIRRTLKECCNVALSEELNRPIIDFDDNENLIYVLDAFFAYYLKWTTHEW